MDRYAVLVFRQGAPLTTEQQIAFTRNFGDLEAPYTIPGDAGRALEQPGVVGHLERVADRWAAGA